MIHQRRAFPSWQAIALSCGLVTTLIVSSVLAGTMGLSGQWGRGTCLLPAGIDHSHGALRWTVTVIGLLHYLVVPGWLWISLLSSVSPLVRFALSPFLWLVVWIPIHGFLRGLDVELTRDTTTLIILLVEVAAIGGTWLTRGEWRRHVPDKAVVIALATGLSALLVFGHGKVVDENFTGDGVEGFSFARSLHTHSLPHWDLENGTWGFYPQFLSFAYPINLSLLFLGECEAAARLPVVVFACVLAASLMIGSRQGSRKVAFALAALLVVVCSGWNYTYNLYSADITEPTVTDLYFACTLVGAFIGWKTQKLWAFGMCSALAITALPTGFPVLFLLLCLSLGLVSGQRMWMLKALCLLVFLVAARDLLSWLYNSNRAHQFTSSQFTRAHMTSLFQSLNISRFATLLWAFVIQSGGGPLIIGIAAVRNRCLNRRVVVLLLVSAAYLAAALLTPKRHPHYLTPIAVIWLFTLSQLQLRFSWGVWLCIIAGLIVGVTPHPRPKPDMRSRELGNHTVMVFPNEKAALSAARRIRNTLVIRESHDEKIKWGSGRHAYVLYSTRFSVMPPKPPEQTHLLLTRERSRWRGFALIGSWSDCILYERPRGWLERQRRQVGCTDCWGPLLKLPNRLWDRKAHWKADPALTYQTFEGGRKEKSPESR